MRLFDGEQEEQYILKPHQSVYIAPLIWDSQIYFKNSIALVLCSTLYDRKDYIEDIEEFKEIVNAKQNK